MKIGSKLLLTYFIILASAFFFTALFSNLIWHYYLLQEIHIRLNEEVKAISSNLMDVDIKENNLEIEGKVNKDQYIDVFEKKIPYSIAVKDNLSNEVFRRLNGFNERIMNISKSMPLRGIEKASVPILAKNGKTQGKVELYTHIKSYGQISRLTGLAQLLSLIFAGCISIIIAFLLKNYMIKPIKALKEEMEHFSLHGNSKAELDIRTGDELEELGKSFSAMANKLRKNNEQQKIMLQNMSHTLKTPLMSIQGHAEAIMEGIVSGDEAGESLETIRQESQRMKKIIENMIYLYRMENVEESFHFEMTDLRTVIDNAIGEVKLSASNKGVLIQANCTDNCIGMFDSEKLEEAIVNILSNCVRYADACIEINFRKENDNICITVKDDGTGFKNNEEKLVFERFYKGDKGHSGIGLNITRAIVEGHNGSINVRNGINNGAIFDIELPINS